MGTKKGCPDNPVTLSLLILFILNIPLEWPKECPNNSQQFLKIKVTSLLIRAHGEHFDLIFMGEKG